MTRRSASLRSAAIDRRTRVRRIAQIRLRRAFARQPDAVRQARLAWLAQLAETIDSNGFTAAERLDAEAALIDGIPASVQGSLPLRSARDA